MLNKLTCKVRFHIAVWSLSKSIRASSFIENFPQISAKPIAFQRNLLGNLPRNRPLFTNRFSAKLASKIPAKFPRNRPFFPRICPWKSREIWPFFPRPTRSPDMCLVWLKALVNEDTLLRTHCCPRCFLGCANWETFVADTNFVSTTMLNARANRETFVSATMCLQQCVLVCQGLNLHSWGVGKQ